MVHVSFEYRGGQLLSLHTEYYPPYRKGDIVWLQDSARDLALTKFRVRRVEYSVERSPIGVSEAMYVYLKLASS